VGDVALLNAVQVALAYIERVQAELTKYLLGARPRYVIELPRRSGELD
jgi:tRNA nucleotidyltransferase/poly(A) polymerase